MPQFFQFTFERISFWLGFAAATLFWWVISRVRPMLPIWWKQANEYAKLIERRNLSGMEDALRRSTLRAAQRQHLASSLFALDEVLVEPRLIAPPPVREPGGPELSLSVAGQVLPYLPDWPELATPLGAPTITLAEALQNGHHIAVIGQPGIGKTVALAHLASQLARDEVKFAKMKSPNGAASESKSAPNEAEEETTGAMPLYFHALDLDTALGEGGDPLQNLLKTLSGQVGVVYQGQLPKYIQTILRDPDRRIVLIIDGLDELPPARLANTINYLTLLLQKQPALQAVIAAPADYLDGLTKAGFYPLGMASWTYRERRALAQKWGEAWNGEFLPEVRKHYAAQAVELSQMNSWLEDESSLSTSPLDWVLRVWGAFAGDVSGSHRMGLIDAHLTRFLPSSTFVLALEDVAHRMVQYESSTMRYEEMEKILTAFRPTTPVTAEMMQEASAAVFGQTAAQADPGGPGIPMTAGQPAPAPEEPAYNSETFVDEINPVDEPPASEGQPAEAEAAQAEAAQDKPKTKKKRKRGGDMISSQGEQILDTLLNAGVLVQHSGGLLRFASPVFLGYLAGMRVTEEEAEVLAGALDWPANQQALQYTAACNDAPGWVSGLLGDPGIPLCRSLLRVARWLRDAPPEADWRSAVMRAMIGLLQMETLPIGTRARLVAAFVASGDASVSRLFKQLLGSKSPVVCQLALMGAGALNETEMVKDILSLIGDRTPAVRYAACLALAAMPGKEALEALVHVMLEGDEDLRQAAAEALALIPPDGHKVLEEAAAEEDLLTRRASVFGLAQVHEEWARKQLEKLAVEDGQWVVRNAAAQALETVQKTNPSIPRPLTDASETGWLLAFASKLGLSIAPGTPATDVLLQVLKSGSVEEQSCALQYLREIPEEGIVGAIYNLIYGQQAELQEPALQALWWMSLSGKPLPSPTMFGLG